MTEPDQDRTPTTPAAPTVSTAPAGADSTTPDVAPRNRWWSAVPHHLGRARTSTVILGVLFVAVFALWLNVRPPTDGSERPRSDDPGTEQVPVVPGLPEDEPTESAAPTPTAPRTTTSEPTTTPPTRTGSPTTSTSPEPTTGTTPSAPAEDPTGETVPDSPTG